MSQKASSSNPWGVNFAGQVTYYPTGVHYGVGSVGSTIHASLELDGNNRGVVENLHRCWALFEFDLPTKVPLDSTMWAVPFDDTKLKVHLLPKVRGDELWSSLNTTTLPEFTRVSIKAAPTFAPDRILHVAETVLENIDLLLLATDQVPLPTSVRTGLSLRADFYERPTKGKSILRATVPLTGEVRYDSPSPVPITAEVKDRLAHLRSKLVTFISERSTDGSFVERLRTIVHDFSFFGRQHPAALSGLTEPLVRDLLLVVLNTLSLTAEGEASNLLGRTDVKASNPDNKYEIAVIELKYWTGEDSIRELMTQAFETHVTGQEVLVVCQVLSRNVGFMNVVDQVRELVECHPQVSGPLLRVRFEGSREVLYEADVDIHGYQVPLLLSCVNLHHPRDRVLN